MFYFAFLYPFPNMQKKGILTLGIRGGNFRNNRVGIDMYIYS